MPHCGEPLLLTDLLCSDLGLWVVCAGREASSSNRFGLLSELVLAQKPPKRRRRKVANVQASSC
jgi:hypothetical protein